MKTEPARNIDDYIASFPEETRKLLQRIRAAIARAAPGSEEKISYGIPTITLDGRYLIYFAGYKKHISVYPAPRGKKEFKKELAQYKGGKGTAQFPLDKPIPFDLIDRMVKSRMKTNADKAGRKKAGDHHK